MCLSVCGWSVYEAGDYLVVLTYVGLDRYKLLESVRTENTHVHTYTHTLSRWETQVTVGHYSELDIKHMKMIN